MGNYRRVPRGSHRSHTNRVYDALADEPLLPRIDAFNGKLHREVPSALPAAVNEEEIMLRTTYGRMVSATLQKLLKPGTSSNDPYQGLPRKLESLQVFLAPDRINKFMDKTMEEFLNPSAATSPDQIKAYDTEHRPAIQAKIAEMLAAFVEQHKGTAQGASR